MWVFELVSTSICISLQNYNTFFVSSKCYLSSVFNRNFRTRCELLMYMHIFKDLSLISSYFPGRQFHEIRHRRAIHHSALRFIDDVLQRKRLAGVEKCHSTCGKRHFKDFTLSFHLINSFSLLVGIKKQQH